MKLDHDYAKEHPTVGQDSLFEDDSLETIILNESLSDDLGFPSFEESQNQEEMNENDIGKYCFLNKSKYSDPNYIVEMSGFYVNSNLVTLWVSKAEILTFLAALNFRFFGEFVTFSGGKPEI